MAAISPRAPIQPSSTSAVPSSYDPLLPTSHLPVSSHPDHHNQNLHHPHHSSALPLPTTTTTTTAAATPTTTTTTTPSSHLAFVMPPNPTNSNNNSNPINNISGNNNSSTNNNNNSNNNPNSNSVSMENPTETPHDLYCLARDYERRGRMQDAANLYLKASMNGHLSAMVAYATHLVPTDERAAFVWFRAAAERGDPRAWYELGQLLARGRYFEVNAIDAARCWKRAAQMGDNTGKSALGLCYIRGFGVKQDPEKGVEIVKQVADIHNDVTAMKNLAWIYRHGKGVQKNLRAAEYWEERAKKQEDVMRHVTSREQVLFGRGRLRATRQKRDNTDPNNSNNSTHKSTTSSLSRPGTRENSGTERAPTPDTDSRLSKDRDSFRTNSRPLQVDELEDRLRSAPSDEPRPHHRYSTTVPSSDMASATANVMDEAAPLREQLYSPNPVRGSHLSEHLEGNTRASQGVVPAAITVPNVRSTLEPSKQGSVVNTGQSLSSTSVNENVTSDSRRADDTVKKDPDPALEAEMANISFVQKDPSKATTAPSTSSTRKNNNNNNYNKYGVVSGTAAATAAATAGAIGAAASSFSNRRGGPGDDLPDASTQKAVRPEERFDEPDDDGIENVEEDVPARRSVRMGGGGIVSGGNINMVEDTRLNKVVDKNKNNNRNELSGADVAAGVGIGASGVAAAVSTAATTANADVKNIINNPNSGRGDPHNINLSDDVQKASVGITNLSANQNTEGLGAPVDDFVSPSSAPDAEGDVQQNQNGRDIHQQNEQFLADPPHNIGPAVSSRKKIFEGESKNIFRKAHQSEREPEEDIEEVEEEEEEEEEDEEDEPLPPLQEQHPHQPQQQQDHLFKSRPLSDGTDPTFTREDEKNDFDNFEDPELKRVAQASVADATDSVEDPTRSLASTARGEGDATSTVVTQNTDMLLQRATIGNMARQPPPMDASGLERLHQVLTNFPRNPMRADSQAPLKVMVKTIQEVAISNNEAFSVIDNNMGFFKVIVAMISQHEDEHIQEHGLHCLLRILRATSSATKESAVLTSYADCFKIVQGNDDVIVPKGTVGVNENTSGAIQAIVLAMRHHATVRRIQLAGCATLSEVASTSRHCRSICLEQGSINLLLACLRHRSSASAAVIHEMAGRAISSFCSGKDNVAFKETFTNAGIVSELLNVLQLWGHNEEATSDLMTNATICCCSGLRHVTDGFSPAAIQCVQSFAYHHLIRIMVLRRPDVAVCTIVLAALTSITRNAGAAAEKPLTDAKPLPEVLLTMQVHKENAPFIRKALDFMEALGSYTVMKEEIVVAGGIPFAADIIEQGGSDSQLLEKACGVVEKLCRANTPNQEIFASRKGIKSLTNVLNTHSRQPGVVERALLAMSSVTSNNAASQREALRSSSAEELVRVLTIYCSKNGKVVAACAGAMSALVVSKNVSMAQAFGNLKAPELVARAMKRHPDSVLVQENGSAAIAAFCEAEPPIMSSLLKSGITTILIVALQRFLHKQTAVVQIVRAMRAITNEVIIEDSYRFKSRLLSDRSNESSLPEIFHTALSYHKRSLPETANVIISICATINRLCMRSVAFKNEVGKDGIVEELKRLVERTAEFKDLDILQPVLATICTLVLESEDNKNRFHSVGGVEAILDVMQKWKHHTYVLEHCCAALRYSCNDHFGNCTEVKNHNGVRSILGVMEMHPDNVNVTLWCCLTLADLCKGDEELQSSATVVQGIRKVVSAMNMFSTNSRFLSSACEFLRAASACNVDNQERIVRLGGRTAIVKALEAHPTDSALTESAAYALLQIQDIPDPRSSMDSSPQLGLVKRLSRDLRRSGSSSNRSSRSKIGRKSLSFTSRRRTAADAEEEQQMQEGDGGRRQTMNGGGGAGPNMDHHQYAQEQHMGNEEGEEVDEDEVAGRQHMRGRSGKTSSFINLNRLIPRRRSSRVDHRADRDRDRDRDREVDLDDARDVGGAEDGYGEYDEGEYMSGGRIDER